MSSQACASTAVLSVIAAGVYVMWLRFEAARMGRVVWVEVADPVD